MSKKHKGQNGQSRKAAAEKKQKILLIIAACAVAFTIIGAAISALMENRNRAEAASSETGSTAGTAAADAESTSGAAKLAVSADDINITHYADITIDGYGTVTVALDETAAPETVRNFVSLAESGFYDGLTFHRIIDGFMMQGGDPNGDGTGGSSETIKGEFSENGFENNLSHVRGAISMARSNNMNSASSQFFIVQSDSTFLDGQYAAFGYVTEGMDLVDQICADAQPTDNNGSIAKDAQPVIESIAIRENTESQAS